MKKKLVSFQEKLMDIILLSGIVLIGILSLIGAVYSFIVAFTYLNEEKQNKWTAVFSLKLFLSSVFIELFLLLTMFILFLNIQLLSSLSVFGRVSLFSIVLLFFIVGIPFFFVLTWLISKKNTVNKKIIEQALYIVFVKFPLWLVFIAFIFIVTLFIYMDKALIIVGIGGVILFFDYLIKKGTRQLLSIDEGAHL